MTIDREEDPRFTRTIDYEIPTDLFSKLTVQPPAPVTGNSIAQGQEKFIRSYQKELLGKGSFGEVWKAVDVDSGGFVALKIVDMPKPKSKDLKNLW